MQFEPSPTTSSLDEAVSVFTQHRPSLFGIAYRVLGSVVEAEDVVQEVWLRWQKTDRSAVLNPVAFLATATTRLAINVSQSARLRRETYVGPWLPEPIDTSADPQVGAQRAEALELALLLVMEKLGPTERAAYVLREAFDYSYPEIAEILQITPGNARKIVSRARKRVAAEHRESVDPAAHRRLVDAFVSAAQTGDVASLEALLAEDAVSLSDGNGIRGAARVPVRGRARVANLATATRRFWREADPRPVEANGRTGMLIHRDGEPAVLLAIAATKEGIRQLMWVFTPGKIAAFLDSRSRCTAFRTTGDRAALLLSPSRPPEDSVAAGLRGLPRPVAVVVGAGGVLGAAHVGAGYALEERGFVPDMIVGTSVGALMGAIAAAHPDGSAAWLDDVWTRLRRREVYPIGYPSSRASIFTNSGLRRLVARSGLPSRIEELAVPFTAVAMDLDTGDPALLDHGDLESALLASSAVPGILPPVDRDGRTLVDGGVIAYVPVLAALQAGAASVVVLSTGPEGSPLRPAVPRRRAGAIAARAGQLLMRHQIERDLHEVSRRIPTVVLPTGIENWPSPWNFRHSQRLISTAYKSAGRFLDGIRVNGPGLYRTDGPPTPSALYGTPAAAVWGVAR